MFKGCSGCFKGVSRFLLYVSGYFKGAPIYFNNVLIVSYMFPVVSKLFQGCFKVSPICFIYVFFKLFLVVSGNLNCFWLFQVCFFICFYMFPICSYLDIVFLGISGQFWEVLWLQWYSLPFYIFKGFRRHLNGFL